MLSASIKNLRLLSISLILIATSFLFIGCGGDDNPTGTAGTTGGVKQVAFPLEGAMTDIQLVNGQTTHLEFVLHVPPGIGKIDSATLDVVATLQNATKTAPITTQNVRRYLSALTSGDALSQSFIRIGYDPSTVCSNGYLYGPYDIQPGFFGTPDPETIDLDFNSVVLLNNGQVAICMDITSTIDATFNLDEIEGTVYEGSCDETYDFSGVWAGTYECSNSCGGSFGDTVQITVIQNGTNASYTDLAGDTYIGTVCGNIFRFSRSGDATEVERGSLTLEYSTMAIKRSTWRETESPYCTGNCTDYLNKVVESK